MIWRNELNTYIARIILFMTVDHYSSWIILFYLWNLTGYSLYTYLTTIMFMLLRFAGKILLHGNNTRMFTCYIPVIPVSCTLTYIIFLLYRYPDLHMLILLPW